MPPKPPTRKHSPSSGGLRLPGQFKPERTLDEAPFRHWVRWMLSLVPSLSEEDLIPTPKDLEMISKLAYSVDDLGNKLAAEIVKNPNVARQLEKGLAEGIESLEAPSPVLAEFLQYYENIPDFRGPETGKKAKSSAAVDLFDTPWFLEFIGEGIGLSIGFFVGANYPAVGRSIVSTGSVARGPSRMIQTLKFGYDIGKPGAFRKFGPGVQACAKVRLAHAFARMQIARGKYEWDEDYYGLPISEFDNMIFLSGMFAMSNVFGGALKIDNSAIFRSTQYGLAAPKPLMEFSPQEMLRFFVMVLAHLDDSPETAREVVHAFYNNRHYKPERTIQDKLIKELTFLVANFYTRFSYGNTMADDIGLDRHPWGLPLPQAAAVLNAAAPAVLRLFEAPQFKQVLSPMARLSAPMGRMMKYIPRSQEREQTGGRSKRGGYTGSFGAFKGHQPAQAG